MGTKRALIVANRDYEDPTFPPLPAAVADANALNRVLADPEIGAFDVGIVENGTTLEIKRAIEALFSKAGRNDQLLLHLSCHGIRHVNNRLYFITRTTERDFLGSTAIEADFVNDQMEQSRSTSIVLFLDCCYSGAFARGFRPRTATSGDVNVEGSFSGKGHIILTASTALQFSYERDAHKILNVDLVQPALFSSAIVRGLETGEADKDEDGQISVNELYDYVYDQVTAVAPGQTPTISGDRAQGTLYIARSPRGAHPSSSLLSRLKFERKFDDEGGFSFPVPVGWKEIKTAAERN
jgi:molecular chaperone DnaK